MPGGEGMPWHTGVDPMGQLGSLELAPTRVWPVELQEGWESQESVVLLLPTSLQNWNTAGLSMAAPFLFSKNLHILQDYKDSIVNYQHSPKPRRAERI